MNYDFIEIRVLKMKAFLLIRISFEMIVLIICSKPPVSDPFGNPYEI